MGFFATTYTPGVPARRSVVQLAHGFVDGLVVSLLPSGLYALTIAANNLNPDAHGIVANATLNAFTLSLDGDEIPNILPNPNWIRGEALFLSTVTSGLVTSTRDRTTSGALDIPVAYATGPNSLRVQIRPATQNP
jgi:hypothetical protein